MNLGYFARAYMPLQQTSKYQFKKPRAQRLLDDYMLIFNIARELYTSRQAFSAKRGILAISHWCLRSRGFHTIFVAEYA